MNIGRVRVPPGRKGHQPRRRTETTHYSTIVILILLAALFSYVNSKFLKLARAVGVMLQAFVVSLILIGLGLAGVPGLRAEQDFLSGVSFNNVVLGGVLSFLLFAGALQVCFACLVSVRAELLALATAAVVLSTLIVGFAVHYLLKVAGIDLSLTSSLLFGALISPTDPVAVLPVLRRLKIPSHLQALIEGESLLNDGVAIVVFTLLLNLASGHDALPLPAEAAVLFAREALGGIAFGLVVGYVVYWIVKTIDDYPVEILITLALVVGGYAGAQALGISGPLAMVTAGIVIGNHARPKLMSPRTSENLDRFWEMVDVILNAVLFVLIGLEVVFVVQDFSLVRLLVSLAAIVIVLVARFVSVGTPLLLLHRIAGINYRFTPFLTWAGLRGAIPIALVLSLPPGNDRGLLVTMTYVIVVFSILVQGMTLNRLPFRKEYRNERHE